MALMCQQVLYRKVVPPRSRSLYPVFKGVYIPQGGTRVPSKGAYQRGTPPSRFAVFCFAVRLRERALGKNSTIVHIFSFWEGV